MSLTARLFTSARISFPRHAANAKVVSKRPQRSTIVRQYTSSISSTPSVSDLGAKQPGPRLSLTFTCTAPDCSHRSTHEFSKSSYERGIVLVQCPNCKNRHLIADHLGWFKEHEGTAGGTLRTVEDLMKAKGEKVKRGRLDAGGVVEYVDE